GKPTLYRTHSDSITWKAASVGQVWKMGANGAGWGSDYINTKIPIDSVSGLRSALDSKASKEKDSIFSLLVKDSLSVSPGYIKFNTHQSPSQIGKVYFRNFTDNNGYFIFSSGFSNHTNGDAILELHGTRNPMLQNYLRLVQYANGYGEIITTKGALYLKPEGKNVIVDGTITQSSDLRDKEEIQPLQKSLEKIKNMRGVSFVKKGNDRREIGLIAQEVEDVVPEVVYTDNMGYKSLSYDRMVALLIEAIKEQQQIIDSLRAEVKEIKSQLQGKE
ncbi:MAG: tail fiber domain-containing protein, partial [Chitinispirillaceae bacterium]|nr:tail fiber domain-containing protein [Chitinispirillaceae bacterium]